MEIEYATIDKHGAAFRSFKKALIRAEIEKIDELIELKKKQEKDQAKTASQRGAEKTMARQPTRASRRRWRKIPLADSGSL